MRMYMLDANIMCAKHLIKEHRDILRLYAHMARKKSIYKMAKEKCIEPSMLCERDAEVVDRLWLRFRFYAKHSVRYRKDWLKEVSINYQHELFSVRVDQLESLLELVKCPSCVNVMRSYGDEIRILVNRKVILRDELEHLIETGTPNLDVYLHTENYRRDGDDIC